MQTIIPTTPFGRRPLTLAMVASQAAAGACPSGAAAHKWQVFRDGCEGRGRLGVPERALTVLNALLTFHPDTALAVGGGCDLVVFPSNDQLSLRAHGMAASTLRRHLAALVDAGLIIRRDSPNGKRFAWKGQGGGIEAAFGLDLTPLVARAPEFAELAREAREARKALMACREAITLLRRDLSKTVVAGVEAGVAADWGAWARNARASSGGCPGPRTQRR